MKKISTIELHKENMKFSAGHFTVFGPDERENLHGHNYNVYAALTVHYDEEGLAFDYRYYKKRLLGLCKELNQTFLIPGNSKHLTLETDENYTYVVFDNERIPFLERDIKIVPMTNVTVEELSRWFVAKLTEDQSELDRNSIDAITVKVYSGPGQSGSAYWERGDD